MATLLPYTRHCFVCGKDNAHGLRLRFRADAADGTIHADYVPRDDHAGYPGILHGGAVGAALDEAMFWAATHAVGRMHMSVELSVRYREKTRTGAAYRVVARLDRQRAAMCVTSAELLDADGAVCASATGKYLPLPREDAQRVLADVCPDPDTVSLADYVGE